MRVQLIKWVNIVQRIEGFKPFVVERVPEDIAQERIAKYEREDKYEAEVEGLEFPHGMPKYTIEYGN